MSTEQTYLGFITEAGAPLFTSWEEYIDWTYPGYRERMEMDKADDLQDALEEARKEGYDAGYKDAQEDTTILEQNAYNRGYADAINGYSKVSP